MISMFSFFLLTESSTIKAAYIEEHGDILGSLIGVFSVIITILCTYFFTKRQIKNSNASLKKRIDNYNKTLGTKIIEYRKNSYDNTLYLKDNEKLNNILKYVMRIDIQSLNLHNNIYQAMSLSKEPVFINSKFLEKIEEKLLKKLDVLKDNDKICLCILELGHIGSSVNSLMNFTHLRGQFPIKRTIRSLVKLEYLKRKLLFQSDYICLDKLESTEHKKFIRYRYLENMDKINKSIFSICKNIILSVDNISNLYPYDNIHDKEMKNNIEKMVNKLSK